MSERRNRGLDSSGLPGKGSNMRGVGVGGELDGAASIPVESERSLCKLIKAGGRAWGCFQAS